MIGNLLVQLTVAVWLLITGAFVLRHGLTGSLRAVGLWMIVLARQLDGLREALDRQVRRELWRESLTLAGEKEESCEISTR